MSEDNYFQESFPSLKNPSSSLLEDKLSKEILPYEIEISTKNTDIVFPLYEKMRYNKMKELVPYDKYIGRYIITKNVKNLNSLNNNNGILWKINAIDNLILKLENINNNSSSSMSISSNINIVNNPKLIDLGDKENMNKIFLVEYAFLSKSYPDNFILIVSNFYNNNSLISKETNGEVSYCGFTFNFSSSINSISTMISDSDKGLIFHEKIKANTLIDIKTKFSNNNNNNNINKNIFLNDNNWNSNGNNNLLANIFSNNTTLYKNFLLCMEVIKKYKNFLRNIEYKEIELSNLRKQILYEIVYDNSLYLLLDYNMKYDSYLLKKYYDGEQKWVNLSNINLNLIDDKSNKNVNNNNSNVLIGGNSLILCNILKGLVCMSSLQYDNNSNYYSTNNNFSNINNYNFNRYNYEFENTITIPIFDNPLEESKIILGNRKELLSHFECSKCMYKINNFESYLCQTCKKLYHRGCIDKDENKNPLLYHYFFCNNINCSPCVICKSNQPQLSSDKFQCQKCKFVFHSKCLIKEIRDIYMNLNHDYFLCDNCIKCLKCGLNAYNINTDKKDNKFNCETNMCLYCERKINKKEFCPICDELWYNKDNNLLIECSKCKYFCHKSCDRILFSNINNNYIGKKNKYMCPTCRINKKTNLLNNLIKELKNLDKNEYFIEPIDLKAIPNYAKVIKNPICFKDIENKNSKENVYLKNMDKFFEDVYLIVDNAMLFNMPRTLVYEVALDMKKEMRRILNEKYKLLYQLSMDYWLFDFNDEKYVKKQMEEKLNYIKNNFQSVFWKYIQNRNKEENGGNQNNNIQSDNNNENEKENINPDKFKEEMVKFGNEYIQQNIFDYCITWNWLTDLGLIPYNKDIKISNTSNNIIIDNYDDSKNLNNDVYINIDQKNSLSNYTNSYNNINNNGKICIKKKFKSYDEISYELDFHNSNFESSKKCSKFLTSSSNISHTMDLILNKHIKNLDYLDTNELMFNNYEKNIDNDKKLSFLYPDKFRYYLPTKRQNLKSAFNDFMSSFIIRLDDNKKGNKLKKKLENNNDKDNNFEFDENDDYNNDDRNDQDYTVPGGIKNKNGNSNKGNKKKKKMNKIINIKLSKKRQRSFNSDHVNLYISENSTDNKNNIDNEIKKENKNQNSLISNINNNESINIDINNFSDNNINDNEYLRKEIIKKLSNKFITICFSKFSLIFEPNCSLCGSFEDLDKLIFCRNCENAFHYYCIDESIDIKKIQELNNWRCTFCKICSKCEENITINDISYKNKNILFCKSCDNCYHVKCLPFIMNNESYKFKCEKCFKCIMCKSNKYYSESFPINKNKDYSFFTRDYEYCYECGIEVFYNSLCNKCLLSDFKNYSKKLVFIKSRKDFEDFENDYNINNDTLINININNNNNAAKNDINDKFIIMLFCDICKSWCHCTCFGMNYLEIKEYFNKFKDMDCFICLDCYLKNKLGEKYNKLSAITYLEILNTSFKLMVLSKIIMIILKGHYKEVNSSVKLHSKLIKGFIKNNYELMLKNKNIQMLFFLFKLDIFLIKESNSNISNKKNKKIKNANNNNNENTNEKSLNNNLISDSKNNNIENNKNNNDVNENENSNNDVDIYNKIKLEYDEDTEIKLNEVYKEQTKKNLDKNIYWKKHLIRILLKKYKRKSLFQRINKIKYLIDIGKQRDYNYNYHFNKRIYKYDSLNPQILEDKDKFNHLTFFNLSERSQSTINYEIKTFFKANNDIKNQIDYPSDVEFSLNENEEDGKNGTNKLLGNKIKSSNDFENNNNDSQEKGKNDMNINNKKKKCYCVAYGNKKKLSKILKKYTNSTINNETLSKISHYIPNSIIDMYEYDIDNYFKLEEEEKYNHDYEEKNKNENINSNTNNRNDYRIIQLTKEIFYNLLSLKNNYTLKEGEKKINYKSKIIKFMIRIVFESIRYIRELLLNWLINTLLEESMNNNIYKNVEEIISKSESSPNNINLEELNKYFDQIDKLVDSPNRNQECGLCHRKGGRELSGRLIFLKNDFWVHINCLYWSKSLVISNNNNEISQIESVINKSSAYKCFLCKCPGATVFCSVPKCERKYHFLCGYLKKCSFMKDNKIFCNRCAHCHKDDTEEVIKINLHKYFIIKNNKDNNTNENINLGNAFKDSNIPKYQVGMYNKIGNNTILKFFQINSKELSFETLDLAIVKVRLISKNIEMVGINESGTYYFKNIALDINKIKNSIFKNNIYNCRQKSNFNGLIQDLLNEENKDNENNIDNINNKEVDKNKINIDKKNINNDCIYIQPMRNKDNSLNLNYCKNRIERDENVEYILSELNKKFIKFNKDNIEVKNIEQNLTNNNNKNHKIFEIFKYFNFGFDIKKIYSSNNPISIIHQYLAVFSQNIPSTISNGGINDLIIKDSDTIKDINNIDNKDENNIINNDISVVGSHSPKSNEVNSEVNSINISTSNNIDVTNKDNANISININNQTKQPRKNKTNNTSNNNNLSNPNLAKLDYFVPLINQKNKINLNQTNHLCFKLENYINSHQELITGKTKLNDDLNVKEDNNIFNQSTSKKTSNKKNNTKSLDLDLNFDNKDNLSDDQIIAQKYKYYLNQQNKKVYIGPSIIHRNGLFATDNIKPGEIVIEYVGEMITNKIADYREIEYNERGFGDCYMFRFDADNIIDATKYGNLARFINHCCEPNCKAQCNEINGKKHILLLAKRFIKTGEEITYDYNFEVESEKIQCRCGAKNCRGRLN